MRTANQKAWNIQQQVEAYSRQALKDGDREAGDIMEIVEEAIQDTEVERAILVRLVRMGKTVDLTDAEGHMRAMEIIWAIEENMEVER